MLFIWHRIERALVTCDKVLPIAVLAYKDWYWPAFNIVTFVIDFCFKV
jgi:hypothetical protein